MKTIIPKCSSQAALAIFALAVSIGMSRADIPVYIGTFDNTSSFVTESGFPSFGTYALDNPGSPKVPNVRFDFGSATASATESIAWSTNDASASPSSGSLALGWTWNATADGDSGVAFTIDLYNNVQTNITSISFDVMVDPISAKDLFGGYGYFQIATRDANYAFNTQPTFAEELGNPTFGGPGSSLAGTWQHFVIPLTGINQNVRAISIQDFNGASDRDINGQIIIYIDNFTINVAGALVSPTNSISQIQGPKGLYLLTTTNSTVDTQQFERQGIATAASAYSWVGSGASPVTYSLTITNYPASSFSNFEAYIFLAPTNSFSGGPTEPNPDWVESDIVTLSIQNNADGSATANLSYKTDDANDNAFLTSVGTVSSTSPIGTWSITFSNDDDVTITSPNGAILSTNLQGNGAGFGNFVTAYIGVQPNSTINVGQQAVFSRFQILSNNVSLLNDDFSSQALNTNTWIVAAEDPTGILQIPPTAVLMLNWTLPATGFALQTTTNLASGSWHGSGLSSSIFNGKGTAIVPFAFIATNNPGFFRLSHP